MSSGEEQKQHRNRGECVGGAVTLRRGLQDHFIERDGPRSPGAHPAFLKRQNQVKMNIKTESGPQFTWIRHDQSHFWWEGE